MAENDLLLHPVAGWILYLRLTLLGGGAPGWLVDLLASAITVGGLGVLVGGLGLAADSLESRLRGEWRSALTLVAAVAALGAARLLWWIVHHPSDDVLAQSVRWDFLALMGCAGCAFTALPLRARTLLLVALSLLMLPLFCGRLPLAIILAGCLGGWLALLPERGRDPRIAVWTQGAAMLAVVITFWIMRDYDPARALRGWGFFSFIGFRHLSFAHEACRGNASRRLDDYLLHILFLNGVHGAMETYAEFHAANLVNRPPARARMAATWAALGALQTTVALQIPMDQGAMVASATRTEMLRNLLVLFVRSSLFSMGIWAMLEAGALLLGIRLRRNFSGVLTATDPSRFWRAWRGTMTNWLIRHVYIPLGGNRAHQTANIFAVFLVSTLWHCAGVPFLRPATWRAWDLAPVIVWGGLNFVGVAAHGAWRRRWPAPERVGAPGFLVRAGKMLLTWWFGSLTVSLLGFSIADGSPFDRFVAVLLWNAAPAGP